MRKVLGSRRNFRPAIVTFGILVPGCDVDSRGNHEEAKSVVRLEIQIDRAGNSHKQNDTDAVAEDERPMEGHLVNPARMPSTLTPGIVGRIEFEDGTQSTCRLLPVSQISLRVIDCDRIRLAVGAGSIVRLQ